jgi:curved DNA-binding protein CbpA
MLHPDACRDPILADVSDQREAVFVRVREAYEALRDPRARAEYEAEQRRRKPRVSPAASAPDAPPPASAYDSAMTDEQLERIIAAGEELLRDGQYGEASQQIEPVLQRLGGGLRIRAAVTLARASMKYPEGQAGRGPPPGRPPRGPGPAQDPSGWRRCLLLGDIYSQRAARRAKAMYRKALTVQPGNKHATRSSRLWKAQRPPGGTVAARVPEKR